VTILASQKPNDRTIPTEPQWTGSTLGILKH
jgi:hypothetical protein